MSAPNFPQMLSGPEHDGFLMSEIDKLAALLSASRQEAAELRGVIAAGLARIDATNERCPVRKSSLGYDICPKCGAEANQNCGPEVTAYSVFEQELRRALANRTTPGDHL